MDIAGEMKQVVAEQLGVKIEEIKPEIIALGYDQEHFAKDLDKEMKKRGINAKVIRIDAYKKEQYKSSKLR